MTLLGNCPHCTMFIDHLPREGYIGHMKKHGVSFVLVTIAQKQKIEVLEHENKELRVHKAELLKGLQEAEERERFLKR